MQASCKLPAAARSSSESLKALRTAAIPVSDTAFLHRFSSASVAATGSDPTSAVHRDAHATMSSAAAAALDEDEELAQDASGTGVARKRMRVTRVGPADSAGLLVNRLKDSPMLLMGDMDRTNSAVIVLALETPVIWANTALAAAKRRTSSDGMHAASRATPSADPSRNAASRATVEHPAGNRSTSKKLRGHQRSRMDSRTLVIGSMISVSTSEAQLARLTLLRVAEVAGSLPSLSPALSCSIWQPAKHTLWKHALLWAAAIKTAVNTASFYLPPPALGMLPGISQSRVHRVYLEEQRDRPRHG